LYEIALTVGKSLDLKSILDDVRDKVIACMGVDAGVIYAIHEGGGIEPVSEYYRHSMMLFFKL